MKYLGLFILVLLTTACGGGSGGGVPADPQTPGSIQFSSSTINYNESAGTVQITVERINGTASDVSVEYAITAGSAIAGVDYNNNIIAGVLNFSAGETSKTFNVVLLEDLIQEGTETIVLSLSNPVLATLGAINTSTLNIIDNDSPGTSMSFVANNNGGDEHEYARQTLIPTGFGEGEFTLQLWVKLDNNYPVGSTAPTVGNKALHWSDADFTPYSVSDWWWQGNFLLDGHNNSNIDGTFSIQIYAGGRVRWLLNDGARPVGNYWAVQASNTNATPSLLDNNWHQISLVRRWDGGTGAILELWIDGALVGTETSDRRTNMRNYWNTWNTYGGQPGWIWGAEKNAAFGGSIYEDYKGLVDEVRFWSRALTTTELSSTYYQSSVTGSEPGLVGLYAMDEGAGTETCNLNNSAQCMTTMIPAQGWIVWDNNNAPLL